MKMRRKSRAMKTRRRQMRRKNTGKRKKRRKTLYLSKSNHSVKILVFTF